MGPAECVNVKELLTHPADRFRLNCRDPSERRCSDLTEELGLNLYTLPKPSIPLVRLALVQPFIDELTRRKFDTNCFLRNLGIDPAGLQSQDTFSPQKLVHQILESAAQATRDPYFACLLYTSPSPRDRTRSRMPSSA